MYNVRGARGTEVIPNFNFWKEIPILVKVLEIHGHSSFDIHLKYLRRSP